MFPSYVCLLVKSHYHTNQLFLSMVIELQKRLSQPQSLMEDSK
uniref:Uncharacterized protein n=1 Tax=Anguilla anguilla TaxID=7936 RepID=A0A0E9QDV5_ANGAN